MRTKKRVLFYALILIAALVLFVMAYGCTKSVKVLVSTPKTMAVTSDKNNPEFFIQKKLEGISPSDSVRLFKKALFYNGCEISIEKALGSRSFVVDDNGNVIKTDSINAKQKIVPKQTSGGLLPNAITVYSGYRGIIKTMTVSFSRNDANYRFTFFRQEDGRFILSGNAEITINGNSYPVKAKTNEACYLLFYFDTKQVIDKTTEQAEGWGVGSTNINNQKKTEENDDFTPSYTPTR